MDSGGNKRCVNYKGRNFLTLYDFHTRTRVIRKRLEKDNTICMCLWVMKSFYIFVQKL